MTSQAATAACIRFSLYLAAQVCPQHGLSLKQKCENFRSCSGPRQVRHFLVHAVLLPSGKNSCGRPPLSDAPLLHRVIGKEKKIQSVKVSDIKRLQRAVYNLSYDSETVLQLAYGRLQEAKYSFFFNYSKHFAQWCHTGETGRGRSQCKQIACNTASDGNKVQNTACPNYVANKFWYLF